ncbi:MAG: AAA family ATPase [Euzebyales bacterium]|nr:AAA family ATPase [Euzebyales bacterium]
MADTSVASRLGGGLVEALGADVGLARERARQHRLRLLATVLALPLAFLWYRILSGAAFDVFAVPSLPADWPVYLVPLALIAALFAAVSMPLLSGRSPHVLYRPEQIDVCLDDVKGLDAVVDEVVKTLNIFLAHALYRDRLGGNPRRGLLFEGAPGTGKTHLAKALAREAGVPFYFVSATSFQSMWYGATARKIRSYFKQLRTAAMREGGAIGFIEEIDAIAMTRNGLATTPSGPAGVLRACHESGLQLERFGTSEGTGGVVNELLVQLQSFDTPPLRDRMYNLAVGAFNSYLPAHRQLRTRPPRYHNILVIAATNRAEDLDPALLRPGRFDRRLSFELPPKQARRELIDHFLATKAHEPALDRSELRSQLAGQTFGYTPVMIEHLLDEALVVALGHGRDGLSWGDVQQARLTGEVGVPNPVEYTAKQRRTVATHEAGHATVAHLAGTRKLEVLSIVKRSGSLGLLAHGDTDEVWTRSRSEMHGLVEIAMGGMCAEEIFFGEAGTGPGGDLAYATETACEIVGAAGMAGSLVSLAAVRGGALNDSNLVGRVLADPSTRPEVDRLLAQAKARARALLDANRHLVEALRDALLEHDELIGDEITEVLQGAGQPVRAGLWIERRGDRRRRDWLAADG